MAWVSTAAGLVPVLKRMAGLAADGSRTDGAGAIAQAIDDARGRRLAAIIIASDGRATESSNLEDALDLARGRQIPIYPLRIGSPRRPRDIDVGPLRADGTVFVKDRLAVETVLSASGLAESTPVTVQLIDEQTKEMVASREVTFDSGATTATVELVVQPIRTGLIRYRLEAVPLPNEEVTENNGSTIDVRIIDERLRVLYVEGYPRYEYRYLKNALLREETISLSVLLLEADEGFVQEGTEPIRRFPNTPEELNRYDVVLFGDVDPRAGWLTQAQMKMLLDYVGYRGGGFGLLAGERAAPGRFRGTPLEKLVPVRIAGQADEGLDERSAGSYRLDLTPEGRRSRLFQTGPEGESWWGGDDREGGVLPALYWVARTAGPKPGATVLAYTVSLPGGGDDASAADPIPLVVTSRYGAGNVFFQATDDTWRWRRHTGEHLHDTYWVRVVRELMRADILAQSRQVVIRTDARVYEYGAAARVRVEVLDPELTVANPEKMEIVVTRIGEAAEGQTTIPRASRSANSLIVGRFSVDRIGVNSNRYEGTYLPPDPGRFRLTVEGLPELVESGGPAAVFHVKLPDAEASRREADHTALERMAGASGGAVIELDELEAAFGAIPDRSAQIPNDITEPLWDSKLALVLFLLLMTVEWTLRKAFGLL
ncbi:MAG: hypothetical protein KJ749_00320 [Planctomycetes bacterium]|nr:hypothetical protein [Planctomycetota bacterium]